MDTQQRITSIFKNIFAFAQIFERFDHPFFLPKAHKKAEHCHQKCKVKLSIVFETAFSDLIMRFQQKCGVKLSVFGKNAELQ